MTKEEYADYRRNTHWQNLRRTILAERKTCEKCEFPYELNVHHLTYARLGKEIREDLIVLCKACHSRHHFISDVEQSPVLQTFPHINLSILKHRIEQQAREAKTKNIEREIEIGKNWEENPDGN